MKMMKTWKQHEWKQKCCHSSSPSLPRTAMAQVLLGRWSLYFEVSLSMTPCLNCSWCCFFGIRMCVTGWLPSRAASHIWCSLWSNRTGSVPPAWSLWGAAEEKRRGFIQAYWPDRLGGSPSLNLGKGALLGSPKPVWCRTVLNTVRPHPHSSILLGCVAQPLLLLLDLNQWWSPTPPLCATQHCPQHCSTCTRHGFIRVGVHFEVEGFTVVVANTILYERVWLSIYTNVKHSGSWRTTVHSQTDLPSEQ